ncbi:7858_t:CDS:2, partial [Acaulospora morrowiae]
MQRSKSHNAPARTPSDNVSQRVGNNNNLNNNATSVMNSNNANGSTIVNTESQQLKGLEWVLGLSIKVKTLNDDDNNSGNPPKYDFRILKISFLRDVVQLPNRKPSIDGNSNTATNSTSTNSTSTNGQNTSASVFSTAVPLVGYVQTDRLQSRELQSVKETQSALARIGVGVTQEAQDIFDALSKTLPCRWSKDSIVVLDEVIIGPPYDIENCKANSGASGSLARVKKV